MVEQSKRLGLKYLRSVTRLLELLLWSWVKNVPHDKMKPPKDIVLTTQGMKTKRVWPKEGTKEVTSATSSAVVSAVDARNWHIRIR